MRAGQREEVTLLQPASGLLLDALDDTGDGEPVHRIARVLAASVPGERRRLEVQREDVILAQEEVDGLPDLVLVRAARRHEDELRGDVQLFEHTKCGVLVRHEIAAADLLVRVRGEPIELQGDVGTALLDRLGERPVAPQTQPVGDHYYAADLWASGDADQLEDLRMAGGLAPGERDGLAGALAPDHPVDDRVEVVERHVRRVLVIDDADGALEVAVVGHFDDRKAGVLLVLVANAAVGRTAVLRFLRVVQGLRAGTSERVSTNVVARILADQRLRRAAGGTALAEVDLAGADHHVDLEKAQAPGAD